MVENVWAVPPKADSPVALTEAATDALPMVALAEEVALLTDIPPVVEAMAPVPG